MRTSWFLFAPIVTLTLTAPATVEAAGFYISDVGVHGLSRAGAWIAGPDTPLALHYNPGALTLLDEGLHVEGDLVNVSFTYDIQRACPCVDSALPNAAELDAQIARRFTPSSNVAPNQNVPFVAAAYQLPWNKLTIALGLYALTSPGRLGFGEVARSGNQAQRYNLIELELYEAFYQLGVAIEPIEGLRLGVVGMLYDFKVTQVVSLWTNISSDTSNPDNFEDASLDIPVAISFDAPIRLNWAAGVSWTPQFFKNLTFGASALGRRGSRAPGTATTPGQSTIAVPPSLASAGISIEGNEIETEVNLPGEYRFGVQLDLPELLEVEASLVIESWDDYERVVVRGKDIFIVTTMGMNQTRTPFANVYLETGFETTYSARLGGELKILEPYLSIRAGAFYETGAVPPELQDASAPDLDKIGFALGFGTTWYGTTINLGANYIILSETTIADSERHIVGALPPPIGRQELITTTGNGTYSGSHLILGASFAMHIDSLIDQVSGSEPEKRLANPAPEATVTP